MQSFKRIIHMLVLARNTQYAYFQYLLCEVLSERYHLFGEFTIMAYLKIFTLSVDSLTYDFRRNCCVQSKIFYVQSKAKKMVHRLWEFVLYQGRIFADSKANDEFDLQVTRGFCYNVKCYIPCHSKTLCLCKKRCLLLCCCVSVQLLRLSFKMT